MWGIRHQFLENVRSRHSSFTSWLTAVRERKSAAIRRSWPDALDDSADSSGLDGSLFIEDALGNLDIEQQYFPDVEDGKEIVSLENAAAPKIFRSKIGGSSGCYPFENLRVAVDVLFLRGSSDVVVAKKAIVSFLTIYLFHCPNCTLIFFSLIYDSFCITCLTATGRCLMRNGDILLRTLQPPLALHGILY